MLKRQFTNIWHCELMNQGTYRSLLYPFVYIETQNGKAPTSVLLFYCFEILYFYPLPNDHLQLGKLYKGQDLKQKMAFFPLTVYGIFFKDPTAY